MAKMLALLFVAGLLAVVHAGEVPSLNACEISAASMDANDFVAAALGGSATCIDGENRASCCEEILGLFGEGGNAEFCMCNTDFFSEMLMGLPANNEVDPTSYVEMLEKCGVPVAGAATCPGTEGDVEPKIQGQVVKKAILLKKILAKGLIAGALLKKRSPPPKAVKGSAGGSVSPPPPPPPPPAVQPAAAGKKSKVVAPPPAKKVVVAAPAKKAKVVEEAPVVVEEPAPVPAPKVTAPAITPKVTAPAGRKL